MPYNSLMWDETVRPLSFTTSFVDTSQLQEMFGVNNTNERKNNMDVRDKICDKCGKRYSLVDVRVKTDTGYTDKEGYLDNQTPLENYPEVYHSRAYKKNVGRKMDLCSECAEELRKFTGDEV